MKLTDEELLTCPTLSKAYKLFDGNGLYAEIPTKGNIRWRFRYRIGGKDKRLSLGVYPEISIEVARQKCAELKELVKMGIDPSAERRQNKGATDGVNSKVAPFVYPRVDPNPWAILAELKQDLINLRDRVYKCS